MKICKKCDQTKSIDQFYKNMNICIECIHERNVQYYLNNKEKIQESHKRYSDEHRESVLGKQAEYRKTHRIELREKQRIYLSSHRKEQKKSNKKYQPRRNELRNKNRKIDAAYHLEESLRRRLWHAIRGHSKSAKTIEMLGYSVEELKTYLEDRFLPGMSWDNYCHSGWHIDHIKPCASFDLTDPIQQLECFNYRNIQPLWAEENFKKGAREIVL